MLGSGAVRYQSGPELVHCGDADMRFVCSLLIGMCASLASSYASAQDTTRELQKLKSDLERLGAETKDIKSSLPSKIEVPGKRPSSVEASKGSEVRRQKDLAIERLERNLEDQRRQRLDDFIILERK